MDTTGRHAFAFPVEAFADELLGVDVIGGEGLYLVPAREGLGPQRSGMVGDPDGISGLPFRLGLEGSFRHLIDLGMKAGGKEKEGIVGEGEAGTPFVNATFAENHRLATGRQCVAYHLPLLETDRV